MHRMLWVAVAEARGHLMRARLMRELMLETGVVIDIATTDRCGQRFLAHAGVHAEVMPGRFALRYDGRQHLDRGETERGFERYLLRGLVPDLRWLTRRRQTYALIVNDSFHPALLAASLFPGQLRDRLVNVYGEHLRAAVTESLDDTRSYLFERALHRTPNVVHSLELPLHDRLRPIIAQPRRRPRSGIAAVYLNPRFSDERVAEAVEQAVGAMGLTLHAVGEGIAPRPGWRTTDPRLCDAIAAADVFIAAPGMATLSQAHAYGTPLIALMTDQPEQQKNARYFPHHARAVSIDSASLAQDIARAFHTVPRGAARGSATAIRARWRDTFLALLERAQPSTTRRRAA